MIQSPPRARRALLLIDFQQDFLDPGGRMPVCQSQVRPVLAAASDAVAQARAAGDLVMAIGNEFKPGDHLMNLLRRYASMAGSPGMQWTKSLPLIAIPYLPKWAGSAFVNPELEDWLRAHQIKTLALCGLMARACITATAKDALALGYRVELVADAIACASDASRDRALARLERKGCRVVHARGHTEPLCEEAPAVAPAR
jgi:nicotinamidase/pyrazinamidase